MYLKCQEGDRLREQFSTTCSIHIYTYIYFSFREKRYSCRIAWVSSKINDRWSSLRLRRRDYDWGKIEIITGGVTAVRYFREASVGVLFFINITGREIGGTKFQARTRSIFDHRLSDFVFSCISRSWCFLHPINRISSPRLRCSRTCIVKFNEIIKSRSF